MDKGTLLFNFRYLASLVKRFFLGLFYVDVYNFRLSKSQRNEYIKLLSKRIFWDMNIEKIDCEYGRQEIIERIAVYGTEQDERIMYIIYPSRVIKKCLIKSDSLNEKTVNYFSFVLKIRKEKFRCYSKRFVQMSF